MTNRLKRFSDLVLDTRPNMEYSPNMKAAGIATGSGVYVETEEVVKLLGVGRSTFYAKHRNSRTFPFARTFPGERGLWWNEKAVMAYAARAARTK